MIIIYIIGLFILLIVGLIVISIVLRWTNKQMIGFVEVNINEWKNMSVINMGLKKRKAILEREVIQLILNDELYEEELYEYE